MKIVIILFVLFAVFAQPVSASTSCAAANRWSSQAGTIGATTADAAGEALDARNPTQSLIYAIQGRHDIAELSYPAIAEKTRTALLAWFDEMIYQTTFLVTGSGRYDGAHASTLLDAFKREAAKLSGQCGSV